MPQVAIARGATVAPREKAADRPAYGRDAGGARYSPLAEIRRDNVNRLQIAWTYRAGAEVVKAASARNAAFEATPILVDELLYLTTPFSRVIALDPSTGKERWTFDPLFPLERRYSELASRGCQPGQQPVTGKKRPGAFLSPRSTRA